MKEKILVDTDNTFGVPKRPIDDGQALLYIMGREDLELVGITTTFGNSTIDDVDRATRWLVAHSKCPDIPIYRGNASQQEGPTEASRFLVEMTKAYPQEISIVAIGTMGNLYRASLEDPDFFSRVKRILCMGGYQYSLPVKGWASIPELNFSRDPEASYAVLNAECECILFDAHVCLQAPFGLRELAPWYAFDKAAYYLQLEYLLANIDELQQPKEYLWDLLPAVYLSFPDLFHSRTVRLESTVEDLKSGTIKVNNCADGDLIASDYITDISRFYEVLYSAWEKSPLRFDD